MLGDFFSLALINDHCLIFIVEFAIGRENPFLCLCTCVCVCVWVSVCVCPATVDLKWAWVLPALEVIKFFANELHQRNLSMNYISGVSCVQALALPDLCIIMGTLDLPFLFVCLLS